MMNKWQGKETRGVILKEKKENGLLNDSLNLKLSSSLLHPRIAK
jgi:hypothetical protein